MMRERLPVFLAVVLCLAVPLLPGIPPFWITVLNYTGLSAIIVLGLVVLTGVGGMTSFGQAMFVGMGAYTTAILSSRYGISPWLTLPVALALTGVLAACIGFITLRLSGHYLPVATIAWNISFFYTMGNLDFFGRFDGISGIPSIAVGNWSLQAPERFYYLIWGAVILSVLATTNLLDSRIGRGIRALKGGRVAAESCGVNTSNARIVAFIYAALLAALSGWLYAHLQRAVNPSPFNLQPSIEYLLMAVIGGAGHVWGALLGAGLVTILKDQLQNILPRLIGAQGNFETIVFGIILAIVLIKARDGLWPWLAGLFKRKQAAKRQAPPPAELLSRRSMPGTGLPVLEVTNLRKTFGGLVAVNNVGFTVKAGEIAALIGPNGAGKSTSFNLITGVSSPTSGEVRLNGDAVTGIAARAIARIGVGRTFQHVKLVASMNVLENTVLGAHLRGRAGLWGALLRLDRAEEARLMYEARRQLERVGLGNFLYQPATSLALGQQRIIEIARALCLDPAFLLLDEPAAGLRHLEKEALATLLRKLREEGVTVLLVEHDMDFVMNLCDQITVMNFGSKLAEGTPQQIVMNPAVIEAYLGSVE